MGDALPALDVGAGEQIVDLALGRTHGCALLGARPERC
jgi:hypothetical protein